MTRDQVFISYSHTDSDWLKRLQIMLAPVQRQGILDAWADTRIQPRQRWKEEIQRALARAKVAVLLVSPEFLASDFIAKHELPPLLEAARKEGLTIFWIPLQHSLYKFTEIVHYQAAYDPKTPLATLAPDQQGAALVQIAEALIEIKPLPSSPTSSPNRSDRVVLPAIKNIHGWSAERVQALQQQTAQALGLPVEFRHKLKSGGQGPVMVVIPGGYFLMGSPADELQRRDNERQHEVEVAPFAIGKYTVTFEEYDRFAEVTGWKKPYDDGWGRGRRPVIYVTWFDAIAYTDWISKQTGQTYRLPTEAEWEYACRAGTITPFYFGETISTDQANYDGNVVYGKGHKGVCREDIVEVGQFPANAWGVHDMHGNVCEWTGSVYDKDYGGGEQCCAEPNTGGSRVLRSGSYFFNPEDVRCAARSPVDPDFLDFYLGFRVVVSPSFSKR